MPVCGKLAKFGAIINDSRAFGYTLRDALNGTPEEVKKIFLKMILKQS